MSTKIEQIDVSDVLDNGMLNYSGKVILDRAIPDVRDGLKPVHRRIVYGMSELNLTPTSPHKKSARAVGEIMGKYHSHGDSAIYKALVGLAQPFSIRLPLVDGSGNFGSISGDSAAAMRYTESRLSKYSSLLLKGLDKNAVQMIPNFDGEEVEPLVLPAAIPLALINGAFGIAWGFSTTIAPHNPLEMIDAAIAVAENDEITAKELAEIIKGPDFPTGGEWIKDEQALLDEIESGVAKYQFRGETEIHDDPKNPHILIKSVPYEMKTSTMIEKIVSTVSDNKLLGVTEIVDESESDMDIKIRIQCKKQTKRNILETIVSLLYNKKILQSTISTNNLLVVKGKPINVGILQYLKVFNEFRTETLINIWNYDIDKLKTKVEIIEGKIRLDDITEEVIELAKKSNGREDYISNLIEIYEFTRLQSEAIARIQLHELGKKNVEALKKELESSNNKIDELTEKVNNPNKYLIEDLKESKKVLADQKRVTKIIEPTELKELVEVDETSLIESKEVIVVVKRDLKLFQMGVRAYENQLDKYKDDDIVSAFTALTTDFVLAATENGELVTRFVNDLPSANLENRLDSLNKEIPQLKASDKFIVGSAVKSKEDSSEERWVLATKNGYMKIIEPNKLLPNVNRKTYVKKATKVFKFKKDDDKIIFAEKVNVSAFPISILEVQLLKDKEKNKKVKRKVKLSKYESRSDSGGSGGFKGLNTSDGEFDYLSHDLVTEELDD